MSANSIGSQTFLSSKDSHLRGTGLRDSPITTFHSMSIFGDTLIQLAEEALKFCINLSRPFFFKILCDIRRAKRVGFKEQPVRLVCIVYWEPQSVTVAQGILRSGMV